MSRNTRDSLDKEHLLSVPQWSDDREENAYRPKQGASRILRYSLALNVAFVLMLAASWVFIYRPKGDPTRLPGEIYSPASEAVQYKTVVFRSGLVDDITEYQGSSAEVNDRWERLYNAFGVSLISQDSARRLPNATTPLPQNGSLYVVQLDVFHQLHCLNRLRKLLYPKVYHTDVVSGADDAMDTVYHLEHCVESLRQSLQCASDTSTIFWEWSPANAKMMGNTATTHTCRDFDRIHDWAARHRLDGDFDMLVKVEGAPIRHIEVGTGEHSSRE